MRTIIGPGNPGTYDWEALERGLGVPRLPTDYKRLYETYSGGHWIVLKGIFVEHPRDLAARHAGQATFIRDVRVQDPARPGRRHVPFPEPGGLLYRGSTEGRDTLCCDTQDPDPDRWPVVNLGYGDVEEFGPIVELLVAELTGVGLGMTHFALSDPSEWAWPLRGPRLPRKYPRRRAARPS
ncbi:SMI1/KNR4 family protein [Spirillospora sp. NPDC029432]|uniref:SMI1/KNR4 family protein n=1 Tax=Spirillospora sp. NPDC029432 TaxID=3154599 RepID=UPI0034524CD6